MSQINVDSIANTTEDGPVYFPYGMRGDASNLIYEPKVLYFDPVPLSTGISTNTNITITFDQQIQFSGVGTIYIREGSPTGSITTSFTCGVSAGATIAGETLVINPTEPIGINTTNYVIIPPVGIANTLGAMYKGTSAYFFQTLRPSDLFSASGGDSIFTLTSPTSPTGYHKYHVFTSTGILTTTAPSFDAADLSSILVAGGGGGQAYAGAGAGGLLANTGPSLGLNAGTYTITIGAGGSKSPLYYTDGGTDGQDSTIGTSPTNILITAYGGGRGTAVSSSPYDGAPGGSGGGGLFPGTSGTGVPGQGNPGGTPGPYSWSHIGGGGGGSGGGGGTGTTTWPPASPTSVTATGGPGGPGAPNPAFTSILLNGKVPTIPAGSFAEIGPAGRYAGGGGGGVPGGPPGVGVNGIPGPGGAGGGGNGGNYSPALPGEDGFANTGGGAGGGARTAPGTFYLAGNGGSGVFMIRYAVPAP